MALFTAEKLAMHLKQGFGKNYKAISLFREILDLSISEGYFITNTL